MHQSPKSKTKKIPSQNNQSMLIEIQSKQRGNESPDLTKSRQNRRLQQDKVINQTETRHNNTQLNQSMDPSLISAYKNQQTISPSKTAKTASKLLHTNDSALKGFTIQRDIPLHKQQSVHVTNTWSRVRQDELDYDERLQMKQALKDELARYEKIAQSRYGGSKLEQSNNATHQNQHQHAYQSQKVEIGRQKATVLDQR